MRPPLGASDLKQNEVNRQNYNNNNNSNQQEHQLSQQYPKITLTKIDDKLHEGQLLKDQTQIQKLHVQANKLKKRETIVENQLNFACSATSTAFDSTTSHNHKISQLTPAPPTPPPPYQTLSNHIIVNQKEEEEGEEEEKSTEFDDKKSITTNSISFVDLSHSTQPNVVTSSSERSEIYKYLTTPKSTVKSTSTTVVEAAIETVVKPTLTQIEYLYDTEKQKRKSLDLAYTTITTTTSSSINTSCSDENVDNVATNFNINYPADAPAIHSLNVKFSYNITNAAPLASIYAPLLTNNYTRQNKSITIPLKILNCETAKNIHTIATAVDVENSTTINNNYNNNSHWTSERLHEPSRHLSTLYQQQQQKQQQQEPQQLKQQQRRSLQFIYNYNSDTEEKHLINDDKVNLLTPQHSKSQDQFLLSTANIPCNTTAAATRKQHAYSWYAPVYSALEEEFDQNSRDSSPIHNLANTKKIQSTNHHIINQQRYSIETATTAVDKETVALLESRNLVNRPRQEVAWSGNALKQPPNTLLLKAPGNSSSDGELGLNVILDNNNRQQQQQQQHNSEHLHHSTEFKYDIESSHASSFGLTGGPLPRRRRFENFIKSLVGLKASGRAHANNSTPSASSETNAEFTLIPQSKPASPEITITRSPSITMPDYFQTSYDRARNGEQLAILQPEITTGSTSSLNVVQQKLRHMLRREGSAASLRQERSQSIVQYKGLRKCETVLALTRQPQSIYAPTIRNSRSNGVINAKGVEQIRPLNRLRHSINNMNAMTCSRCSSLISLAASNSRYSLNSTALRHSDIGGMVLTRLHNNNNNNNNNSNCNLTNQNRMSTKNFQATECTSPTLQQSSTAATLNRNSLKITPPTCTLNSSCELDAISANNANKNNVKYIPDGKIIATTLLKHDAADVSLSNSNNNNNNNYNNNNINDPLSVGIEPKLLSSDNEPDGDKSILKKFEIFTCKLCLIDVETEDEATTLLQCNCQFCTECLRAYIDFEISEGAYEISCPDAQCPTQGRITLPEIAFLTTPNLMKKHHRYRLNREIELDKTRTWCPRAGCETVCLVRSPSNASGMVSPSSSYKGGSFPNEQKISQVFVAVRCPSCNDEFCATCKKTWHPNISCEEHSRRLVADGQDDIGIPFDNDMIKCCPMCAVPIEKDEGCAQMMCKRCKHVFCWYCLASLDDDFLLRHYDRGPCKNKLGHSRASVVWHRAQVIGIFAGFGILLLVASPLLLLAAPCIICCKCRSCTGPKVDEGDAELDEGSVLQR